MRVSRPVPRTIVYRGRRYNWVNNYTFKADAQKRAKGKTAVIAEMEGTGLTKYALYVR